MFIFSEIGKSDIWFSAEKQPLQVFFRTETFPVFHIFLHACFRILFLLYELNLSFTALWTLIQPLTLFSILLTCNALPLHSVTSDNYICKCTHLCLPWKRNILLLDTVFPVCLHICLHIFALRRGTTLVWRLKYEEHYSLICLLHLGKSTSACIPKVPIIFVCVWVCTLLNIFSNLGRCRLLIE